MSRIITILYMPVRQSSSAHIYRHFRNVDPVIGHALKRMDISPLRAQKNTIQYFSTLCRAIIAQQLSTKVAKVISARFFTLFPKKQATPARVLKCSDDALRDIGMSWAKVAYIKDLATQTREKNIRFDELHTLDDEAVIAELTKVKGIGRWTVEMFLIFTLGREDIFSHGDLGLRRGVQRLYGFKTMPKQRTIERIVRKWAPYRSYGSLVLWNVVD